MTVETMNETMTALVRDAVVIEREQGAGRDGPRFRDLLAGALAQVSVAPQALSAVLVRVSDPATVQEDLVLAGDKAGLAVLFASAGDDFSPQGALAQTLNAVASTGPASSVAVVVECPADLGDQDVEALVSLRGHLATAVLVLVGP